MKPSRIKSKTAVFFLCACGFFVLFCLLSKGLLYFFADIISLLDESLYVVFFAWKTAKLDLPVLLTVLLSAVLSAAVVFCSVKTKKFRRGIRVILRIAIAFFAAVVFGVMLAAVLWFSKINSVPIAVLFGIVFDLIGAI